MTVARHEEDVRDFGAVVTHWATPEVPEGPAQARSAPDGVLPAGMSWPAAGGRALRTGRKWIVDGGWK
jgi:hypothetical protein